MQNSKNKLMEYFSSRFGVEKKFWKDLKIHEKGNSLWVTSRNVGLLDRFVASGIRALRIMDYGFKPTTYILQLLNKEVRKNIVDLASEELKILLFDRERIDTDLSKGYVALKHGGDVIGCGLIDSKGLKTQVSKGLTKELIEIIR